MLVSGTLDQPTLGYTYSSSEYTYQPTMGYSYRSKVLPGIGPNAHQPRFYGKAVCAAAAENHPENHPSAVSGENEPSATPFIIARRTAHIGPLRRVDGLL